MQWSRLKKEVESHFSPSVAGRVELRITNYRWAHDWEGRGWITIDKHEVHNFCTHKYYVEYNKLVDGIRAANHATDWCDPKQRDDYDQADAQANAILEQRGVMSQGWFERSLRQYLSLSIEEVLSSPNFLHRALAVLDKRLGKRRLKALELSPTEHPLVIRLFRLRQSVAFGSSMDGAA